MQSSLILLLARCFPEKVTDAVNDTLKAIAASLLMEQVLAPKFDFRPKNDSNTPTEGFDYGKMDKIQTQLM